MCGKGMIMVNSYNYSSERYYIISAHFSEELHLKKCTAILVIIL
jgi:hypothetical protein